MLRMFDGDYAGASALISQLLDDLEGGVAVVGDFLRGHAENFPVFVETCLSMGEDEAIPVERRNLVHVLTTMAVEADRRQSG